jgi:hydrogenase nickel incorporation protein HypA/HybF
MHERALMTDLMREIEGVARADGATRVTRVSVRLGALSHFNEEHFREHFVDASRGTVAEGAAVDAVLASDLDDPRATGVVLESVEVEVPDRVETG